MHLVSCRWLLRTIILGCGWAHAAPSLTLTYQAPPTCPDAEAFSARIASMLGYLPFGPNGAEHLHVQVRRDGPGLSARLELTEADGAQRQRLLKSTNVDCRDLADAVQITVAMIVDPLFDPGPAPQSEAPPALAASKPAPLQPLPEPTPPKAPSRPPAPPPEAPPSFAVAHSTATAPDQPINWRAWLGLIVDQGASPSISPGAALAFEMRRPAWSLGLEGRGHFAPAIATGDGTASATLLLSGVNVCGHRAEFGACVLAQAGWQTAVGAGFDENGQVDGLYLAAGARGSAALSLGAHVALRLNVDLTAPLSRMRLTQAEDRLWETAPIVISSGLMVGWQWAN